MNGADKQSSFDTYPRRRLGRRRSSSEAMTMR
jgi:hypothetical protein